MFRLNLRFLNHTCSAFSGPQHCSLASSAHKIPRRLPHVFQPQILLGATTITGSYLLYLWCFDNEKPPVDYPKNFASVVYRRLPSNAYSHFIGNIGDITIPSLFRSFIFGAYAKLTRCDMTEAKESDLTKYATLSQLFSRELAPGTRPFDRKALINSPCDGVIVSAGPIDEEKRLLEQVKGVTYSLDHFLGPLANVLESSSTVHDPKHCRLNHCVIYLRPGDYHRFHSPTEWVVKIRRHFTGKLLSLRPSFIKNLPGVFTLNERVVYLGEWRHGFMSLTAVGAAGVGSIVAAADLDPTLCTNQRSLPSVEAKEPGRHFHEVSLASIKSAPGAEFGYFKLGSTIVLVFEAPQHGFKWAVKPGDRVKCGETLFSLEQS